MIKYFSENKIGNDYAIGDIHGKWHLVELQLARIGFNKDTDRLFSVGDLVDRGDDSDLILDYLEKPWFHAVRGNHEMMLAEAFVDYYDNSKVFHRLNGGDWFYFLEKYQQENIYSAINNLPLMLEIEVAGKKVGIVHAEVPANDWNEAKNILQCNDEYCNNAIEKLLWNRNRIDLYQNYTLPAVSNIDLVICGHSFVEEPTLVTNCLYIDTGCGYIIHGGTELLPSIIRISDYL